MKRYCAASLSYLFIVMSHSTSLYCSYLMISFHHSCVGNQTVLWKWNKMEKNNPSQAPLLKSLPLLNT